MKGSVLNGESNLTKGRIAIAHGGFTS